MKLRRFWWLRTVAVAVVLLVAVLAVPAWAGSFRQSDGPPPDAYAAMHEACAAGDVQGMTDAMDSLTDEEWQGMGEHMSDGHDGAMGSGMMGTAGMGGGLSAQGMMGW